MRRFLLVICGLLALLGAPRRLEACPPYPPENLRVTLCTPCSIALAWDDNSTTRVNRVSIEHSPEGTAWTEIDTVERDTGHYTHTGLSPETEHYYRVRAYNGQGYSAYSNMVSTTTLANHAPSFAVDPFSKPAAIAGCTYQATLTSSASDPDAGDVLTYSKVSGPSWLYVSSSVAYGMPSNDNVGTNTWTIQVTDCSGATDQASLGIYVRANEPLAFQQESYTLPDAMENVPYTGVTLAGMATDPDGDPITYLIESGTAYWLNVTTAGILYGTPLGWHVGVSSATVRVSSLCNLDTAIVNITVVNCPPTTPTGVTARGAIGCIQLDWDANSEIDLWYYKIHRSPSLNGTFEHYASIYPTIFVPPSTFLPLRTFTDSPLDAGVYYFYKVTAVDENGNESGLSEATGARAFSDCEQRWPADWW